MLTLDARVARLERALNLPDPDSPILLALSGAFGASRFTATDVLSSPGLAELLQADTAPKIGKALAPFIGRGLSSAMTVGKRYYHLTDAPPTHKVVVVAPPADLARIRAALSGVYDFEERGGSLVGMAIL